MREALGYNGYPDWMLAETREEIKEKKREEEEVTTVITRVKREDKKRPVIIPHVTYQRLLRRIKQNFLGIRYTNVFQAYKHFVPAANPPKRSNGEGQSCGSSVQD